MCTPILIPLLTIGTTYSVAVVRYSILGASIRYLMLVIVLYQKNVQFFDPLFHIIFAASKRLRIFNQISYYSFTKIGQNFIAYREMNYMNVVVFMPGFTPTDLVAPGLTIVVEPNMGVRSVTFNILVSGEII
jgi:hypothetical protein